MDIAVNIWQIGKKLIFALLNVTFWNMRKIDARSS